MVGSPSAWVLHDDEPTLALVRSVLGVEGFEVAVAESPYRLLAEAARAAPGLVLLGLTAVEDRDLELVGVLRRRWPEAAILVLFPTALRERAYRALSLGADGYLPEPFYPGELAALARRARRRAVPATAAPPSAAPSSAASPSAARGAADNPPGPAEAPPAAGSSGAVVEQLAAGVAHSIRNPLQILELQLGALETDGTADVAAMREQLRRVAGVVEGLTRFAGHRKLAQRVVDVNQILLRVFGSRRRTAAGAEIVLELANGPLCVLGAPELLRAAFETLRARAERLTPAGGVIEVRCALRSDAAGDRVEVAVTDGGPTLTDEQRTRLFEPYPDADAVRDGTGLDLAALAGIVRDHAGSTASVPGANMGTTILVRLPAHAREEAPPPAAG